MITGRNTIKRRQNYQKNQRYFAEVKIQHNEEESDITICRGTVVTVLEIITDMYNTAALKNISDCADFPQSTLKWDNVFNYTRSNQ